MIDVGFYYSGGSTNSLARNSIGGSPSDVPVTGGPESVFGDLEDISEAFTDFRCLYAFNDSADDTLENVKLYLINESGDAEIIINMGVRSATDEQIITLNAPPTGGTLSIDYGGSVVVANGDSDLEVLSENIRAALDPLASGVTVTSSLAGTGVVVSIRFQGDSDNRAHPLLEVVNALTDVSTAVVTRVREGGPINHVPGVIPNDRTTPNGVSFIIPSVDSPIEIGRLEPGDGFAFWIRRGVPSETTLATTRHIYLRCKATLGL